MGQKYPKWILRTAVMTLISCFIIQGIPSPAPANELGTQLEVTLVPAASVGVMALGGYMLWNYRIREQDHGKLGYNGPGEFYFGGYAGLSLVSPANWSFEPIEFPSPKISAAPGYPELQCAAKNVKTDPGWVGGLRAGYFLDSFPYLGFEGDGSIAGNYRPSQRVWVKPAISGAPVYTEAQGSLFWVMAFHFVFRYGFWKDKEVPFGRLQPYTGIGPNVGCLYFQNDSAKNFGMDTEVGVRYFITKNIAALLEFKYIKQWDVQMEVQHLYSNGTRFIGSEEVGKATHFDVDNQKIVVGMEYHF